MEPGEEEFPTQDKEVIKIPDSSKTVELNGATSYVVSDDGKSRELPQQTDIKLNIGEYDPLLQELPSGEHPGETIPAVEQAVNGYIVQFVTQAFAEYQKAITKLGGKIRIPLPGQALIVQLSQEQAEKVKQLPYVRWVGLYRPDFKLSRDLHELIRAKESAPVRYSILLAEKGQAAQERISQAVKNSGGKIELTGTGPLLEATLDIEQLKELAQMKEVLYIDRWTPAENDMAVVRQTSGADYLESVAGYTGQGVRGEVMDSGLLTTHENFQANPPVIHQGNDTSDTDHGTSVYSIVFGSGLFNTGARGLLPDAQQPIMSSYSTLTLFHSRYKHTAELVDPTGPYRAVFQTNSWGGTPTENYTTVSAAMDNLLFDHDILILQSQSNTGTQASRPQAWAKNILSVGGIRHYNTATRSDDKWWDANINTGASIGPAEDGRIKPDLSHFYDFTYAASDTANNTYKEFGGTSGATPITAGYAGLVFQMWADGVFDGGPGLGRDVFDSRPHMTTLKALLINSAYQYDFTGETHDLTRTHQGWGMADVANLYDTAQANGWGLPILIDETRVIEPLETHTYVLNCQGDSPLKVTLVYADPMGNPAAAVNRINDLSLSVTSPDGTVYWGNNGLLAGNWSTPGGSPNTIDTVENVFIQNPAAGSWTIRVWGDEIVKDGHVETTEMDADYALVAVGGTSPATQAYASLPYYTGFEDGSFDQYWQTQSSNSNGNIQVTTANTPYAGSYHATMDVTSISYNTNEARLYLDLTGQTEVLLEFWWKEFGDETHAEDGVYFSDDGGATFVKVQDLNGQDYTDNTWTQFSLDLDQLAANNGLNLNGSFVVKFQQYDNYYISSDGFAFDDVSVEVDSGSGGCN